MKKVRIIVSCSAFAIAMLSAVAFKSPLGKTNITVGYKDNTSFQTCKTTTCSNVESAFACAQPSDFGSGFYTNNGSCNTSVTVYRAE